MEALLESIAEIFILVVFIYPGAFYRWLISRLWGSKKSFIEFTKDDAHKNGFIGFFCTVFIVVGLFQFFSSPDYEYQSGPRTVAMYTDSDSLKNVHYYNLYIYDFDSFITYKYLHTSDSNRNFSMKYDKHAEILYFVLEEFKKVQNVGFVSKGVSGQKFDLYDITLTIHDGHGPMLFNTTYGALNIDTGPLGYQHLILPESYCDNACRDEILTFLKDQ